MLAIRFIPGEDDFVLEEHLHKPTIENDDDVLIKVEYAGLCGTDIHIVQVDFFSTMLLNLKILLYKKRENLVADLSKLSHWDMNLVVWLSHPVAMP